MLAGCGVPAELMTAGAAAERWPQFDFHGVEQVMFHAEAGVLDPDRAIAAMLRLAAAGGADVRFETPVTRLSAAPAGDGAVAHTDSGAFAAPVIAVAAGAWIAPLLDGLVRVPAADRDAAAGLPLRPRTGRASRAQRDRALADLHRLRRGRLHLRPARRARWRGAGRDQGGRAQPRPITTADSRDFRVDPAARDRVRAYVGKRLPALDPTPVNEATCLYTWTANEDFILDRPANGPFVVASPCSGHGAKFAPLLGEIIADLATGGATADPRFTLAAHLAAS